MIRDRARNVWVGMSDRLVRITANGAASTERRGSSSAVTGLFEDRERNLWIADAGGIERWRDGAFTSYGSVDPVMAGAIGPVSPTRPTVCGLRRPAEACTTSARDASTQSPLYGTM
jgi:hypothetical protein